MTPDTAAQPAPPRGGPATGAVPVYDSARRETPVLGDLRALWRYRGLMALLVRRDVVLRYKRSAIGVWWTLLNPLLNMAVLWVVFSNVFGHAGSDVPYVVYLIAGLVVSTLFSQVVIGVASSMLTSAPVLTKIYVPPVVFAVAAALAAGINCLLSLIPMLAITLIVGVVPSPTALFLFVPMLLLGAMATGIGLALAPLAARFQDTLELTGVLITLTTYLAPVFWPFDVAPERFRDLLQLNPLFHVLGSFRALLYQGGAGPWSAYVVMGVTATVCMAGGTWIFSRTWRRSIASL
jgi:ABC-2 type transport system permease protein